MKYFFLTTILFFVSFQINAQTNKESFRNLTYSALSDSVKKYRMIDTVKAASISDMYIEKARQESDIKKELRGLRIKSNIYRIHKRYALSHKISDSMIVLCKQNTLYDDLISTYMYKSITGDLLDFKNRLDYLYLALDISIRHKRSFYEYTIKNRIAGTLSSTGESVNSIMLNKELIQYTDNDNLSSEELEKLKANLNLKKSYNAIIKGYINLKDVDSASYYNELLKKQIFNNTEENAHFEKEFYLNASEINFLKGDYEAAKESFNKSLIYTTVNDNIGFEFRKSYLLGRIAFEEKKYAKCVEIIEAHLEINSCVTDNEGMFTKDSYQYLGKAYKKLANYERATHYFEKHIHSILELQRLRDKVIQSYKIKESLQYQKEIQLLLKKEESQQSKINYSILLSCLLLVAFLVYIFYKRKQNKRRFEVLLQKIAEVNTPTIINTQEKNIEKSADVSLKANTIEKISKGLQKLEAQEYFLNSECTITSIAKKLKTNPKYISYVIRIKHDKNFKTYINDFRINYALIRLKKDTKFRMFSIESISNEIGYRGSDTFNKHFKKRTGLLPSYYIKQLNKPENK
ncbi:helix-turn-helix domain protein [Kordia sp. SMS9]|uniref:AraC family transcriptional regulator n=1 Tax=Kordia sp. SMS9 TaxID=2282170 RepID=UPI000E100B6E|nr:AraC family transcriptional regulator [Kordia sp. SMS9]AXG70900.1 helix-turn-helix domain protein [Kordia sp. SMS9]